MKTSTSLLTSLAFVGRKSLKAMVLALLAGTALMVSAENLVSEVNVYPRWPWNGKMDIVYVISGSNATNKYDVAFQIKNEDTVLPMNHVEGTDANPSHIMAKDLVTGTGQHVLVWDAGADFPSQAVEDLSCYVSARKYVPPPVALGYMKIDLDTGTVTTQDNAPASWTDDDKSKYLWLRKISSGRFIMGAKDMDQNHPHEVTLTKGFYIGVFELTRAQYDKIGGPHGNYIPSGTGYDLYPADNISYYDLRGTNTLTQFDWPNNGHEVASFSGLGKLRAKVKSTMKSDYLFDLPTDAQLEVACRAGHYGKYWNNGAEQNMIGSGTEPRTDSSLDGLAWYSNTSTVGTKKQAHEVGTKTPSSWGFYDMHGNVMEWCLDWYEDLGNADSATDPKGPKTGEKRTVRSGSYSGDARPCRSAYRWSPSEMKRFTNFGARIALDCD